MKQDEQQQSRFDPRFYLVKITKIKNMGIRSNMINKKNNLQLKLQLGNKSSHSTLQYLHDLQLFNPTNLNVYQDVHIMKYGGQQYLNIVLDQVDKYGHRIENGFNCFARILLPPLIELPHVRHTINVILWNNLISCVDQIQQPKQMIQVTLDLYYQMNFSGRIELIPTVADLQRNIAQIGQMRPIIYLKYENSQWRSLEAEAGIHPCWSGHFYAKRNKDKTIDNIQNIQQNIKNNSSTQLIGVRKTKLFHNTITINKQDSEQINQGKKRFMNKNGPYFDIASFEMISAGSPIKIQLYTLPFIGSQKQLIGFANIRISNYGFLKHPRLENQCIYKQKTMNLYFEQQGHNVKIGTIKFYTRFIFDTDKIINKQPTIFQLQ